MKFKIQNSKFKIREAGLDNLIKILLENRGIKTKKGIEEFLEPKIESLTARNVGINKKSLEKAVKRIKEAINKDEQIVIFGDYDVDGICGTAILWETLNSLGARVSPYIPHRINEGYGLSLRSISNLKSQISNLKLIITVDNGIVANEAVEFANKNGIDVIITDHHVPSKRLPNAYAIVHTIKLCGAGVAYLLAQEISKIKNQILKKYQKPKVQSRNDHLALAALATIADLVPLIGPNRTLVKFGLENLRETTRIGLLALIEESGITQSEIDTYEVGHVIAPRLNAMGRIEYAMDSLRLLCTKDKNRAKLLAEKLGRINRIRQEMTFEAFEHAKSKIKNQKSRIKNLIFVIHESYPQGVIGLVAGKLVEEFYRPSIVVSKDKIYSKASARSISGFNIIEFIRSASEFLVDAGGHPMAAGFTVETVRLPLLQEKLEKLADKMLGKDKLKRTLRIDCELPLSYIDDKLYDRLQKLVPFGIGNMQPKFVSRKIIIEDMRLVGEDGKHLKLKLKSQNSNLKFDAISFNIGEKSAGIRRGDAIDIAYTIERDDWNGNRHLQLKIKDLNKK